MLKQFSAQKGQLKSVKEQQQQKCHHLNIRNCLKSRIHIVYKYRVHDGQG